MRSRPPRTVEDALEALGPGWPGKRSGAEWSGPCPKCGGVDRFHVRPGRAQDLLVHCRAGCAGADLLRLLFPRRGAARREDRPWWDRPERRRAASSTPAPEPHRKRLDRWEASAVAPAGIDALGRWRAAKCGIDASAPWPSSLRGLVVQPAIPDVARALLAVAAPLAPLAAWSTSGEPPSPWPAVHLVHVGEDGAPAKDAGGLAKRTWGSAKGKPNVHVLHAEDVGGAGHVVEGLADALALAARVEGPVVAALGTAGIAKADVSALVRWPVERWTVHADGDQGGEAAARKLVARLGRRGSLQRYPPEHDPCSWWAARTAETPEAAERAALAAGL